MRRRASNDGSVHGVRSVLGLSPGLVRSVMSSLPPLPKQKPKQKGRKGPAGKGSDEMILEVRRLREQRGMTCGQIRVHMADLGFKLTAERILQIVEYSTRSHLVPAANAAPYLSKEKPCTTSTPLAD